MAATAPASAHARAEGHVTFRRLSHLEEARELVDAIQRLSLARSLPDVQGIVRGAARRLTGADGATFVLREGAYCHYADEDAISPLWKGQRFPIESCISGWAMVNRRPALVEDIYADDRIPHEAYRPTFVKSLALVPIRMVDPVGAIGNYWAASHRPTEQEVELLQALADSTAVAMENVRLYEELERRVAERTAQLEARTRELEESNDSIRSLHEGLVGTLARLEERSRHHLEVLNTLAHEVRSPLIGSRLVVRNAAGSLPDAGLGDVDAAISQVIDIVNRQLDAARLEAGAGRIASKQVDVAAELGSLRATFRAFEHSRAVALVIELPAEPVDLRTDPLLLGHVLRNLVANALKFTDAGEVRVAAACRPGNDVAISVSDTGIGIAADELDRVFEEWQQVDEAQDERPAGSGFGLPLVRRIIDALGGRLEVESAPGRGSTFTVVLPARPSRPGDHDSSIVTL